MYYSVCINTIAIFDGNSGGPVVNNSNKVVGVAVKGGENHPNEVIPIEDVIYVFNRKMRKVSYSFLRTD
ncbi:trypsin-like serine protease (plasmid) [Alkalibacillus sp. S2W]|uniref:trypsin-like serine protease n=1 Tax=Alkalibacillus sp. S2W TaxID=3386553 RepID=UPI00398D21EF